MQPLYSLLKAIIVFTFFATGTAQAAIVHFYSYPEVTNLIYHVNIEYQGYIYDADTRVGGIRIRSEYYSNQSDLQVHIPDELINEQALAGQLGLPFDFKFYWDTPKTYCSKMVGIALNMQPQPMTFAGSHYLKYYPDWIHRKDLGLSPEQVLEYALKISTHVTGSLR